MIHKIFLGLMAFFIGLLFCWVVFCGWCVGRKINYNFSYKDLVKQTIIETVKKEALR